MIVNNRAIYIHIYIDRATCYMHPVPTLFAFRAKVYEQRMENHPFCRASSFSSFFPLYMADMPSDLTDSWRSVGRMCFFSSLLFFFPSLSRVRCRVHSKRTSRIDRPSVCVCVWCVRARARSCFCVECARKHTENDSLLSSDYRDEGARKNGGSALRACRRPDEPDDYINQTTTISLLTSATP